VGWVGNHAWTHPPFFSRHLVPQNLRNINFLLIFSIFGGRPKKSQWSPHFSKQSSPGVLYLEPHRKVSATELDFAPQTLKTLQETTKLFSNLNLLPKSGFPKTRDLSPAAPRGVYISRNAPPKNKYGKWQKHQTSLLFDEMASFFMPFLCLFLAPIHFCGPDILLLDI